jgi:hypothetical protein
VPLCGEFERAQRDRWVDTGTDSERGVCCTGYGWLTTLGTLEHVAQRPAHTIDRIGRDRDRPVGLSPSERNSGP